LQEPNDFIRVPRRKGHIPHRAGFALEGNHNPGMLEKIEGSAIALADQHEVYPRAPILHQQGQIVIAAAFCNIIQGYRPGEDPELEL
jgi:hypothetical protein